MWKKFWTNSVQIWPFLVLLKSYLSWNILLAGIVELKGILYVKKHSLKNTPRGSADHRTNNKNLVMKWKDNKEITVVSIFDSSNMSSIIEKQRIISQSLSQYAIKIIMPTCMLTLWTKLWVLIEYEWDKESGGGQYFHICYQLLLTMPISLWK